MTLEYLKNKYNLDFNQQSPIEIVGVGRLDLIRWIRELDFKVGAEIGVDRANFSKLIVDHNDQVKLYGIDPYLKYSDYREYVDQSDMDNVYKTAQDKMKADVASGRYEFIRKPSMEALKDFKDESLDFVYIDGNHEGDYPYQDIKGWAKKVKKGGIVAGHDFVRIRVLDFTVKDALEKYTKENNIHPWFILGRYEKRKCEVRDRTRSWLMVKQ